MDVLRLVVVFISVACVTSTDRIVGGEEPKPNLSPHVVHLDSTATGSFYCGGSLISDKWIVSAAHCYYEPRYFYVVLGDHNTVTLEGTEQVISPSKAFTHPQYNTATKDYDLMLIKLSSPAVFNEFVEVVPLPNDLLYDPSPATVCSVCGWGNTAPPGYHYPEALQCASLSVIDRTDCNNSYAGRISDKMICLGQPQGQVDSCDGDSGGPVVCDGVLAGVVSWGYGCAYPGFPGVNARVSTSLDWINWVIAYN